MLSTSIACFNLFCIHVYQDGEQRLSNACHLGRGHSSQYKHLVAAAALHAADRGVHFINCGRTRLIGGVVGPGGCLVESRVSGGRVV